MTDTHRWIGAAGAALLAVGAGVLSGAPGLLVSGAVLVGFLAVRAGTAAPEPSLSVDRTVADAAPDPGDEVAVEVTVSNNGAALFDLRLVDGVPDGLAVVEGPARHATALSAGGSTTFSYTVRASRGRHEWTPLCAIARDPVGGDERETAVAAGGELRCVPAFDGATDLPLRGLTTPYAGRVSTDIGGSGVEFYAVREYRRGDPLSRVDWNRAARTDELATLQLREERAATVVLVVDARPAAYVAPGVNSPNAVERAVAAGARIADAMLSAGDRVGAAAFSPLECWAAPGTGTAHRAELRETFATDAALGPMPPPEPDRGFSPTLWQRTFRRRLSADAQLLVFSPVVDDTPVRLVRRLDAAGHPVTVVSTDPTGEATPGSRLSAVERSVRLTELRSGGVRVIDWPETDPLAVAADRAARRWSG